MNIPRNPLICNDPLIKWNVPRPHNHQHSLQNSVGKLVGKRVGKFRRKPLGVIMYVHVPLVNFNVNPPLAT